MIASRKDRMSLCQNMAYFKKQLPAAYVIIFPMCALFLSQNQEKHVVICGHLPSPNCETVAARRSRRFGQAYFERRGPGTDGTKKWNAWNG